MSDTRVELRVVRTRADAIFRGVLFASALSVLAVIVLIVGFLVKQSGQAWGHQGTKLLTSNFWAPTAKSFGFEGDLVGSVVIALVALTVATPIALATALAINEFVPRWARAPLTGLVDLLAAVPSLVYGLWGKFFFDRHLYRTSLWLGHHADAFPLFRLVPGAHANGSEFLAGMVVAVMVLPLMTAITREIMSQVPREDCEAALALGGTRWGMITDVVIPFSRSGIVGGAMLALGRALGETIAVSLVLQANDQLNSHILQTGGGSISALIATNFNGSSRLEQSALTVAGLTLFAITLGVNIAARIIVTRRRAA